MIERALIHHFSRLLIDFALNHAAHKFWLVHYHGIKEDQDLPQVILATRAANRAH